jgi:TonB-dependent SusC/RagA subfamily outer membrane receptor
MRLVDDGLEPANEKTPEVLQGVYGQATATDTVPKATKTWTAGPTDKGYTYKVRENNGTGEVTILDKKKKIVKTMTLEEWENNQASLEKQYGELPPPPPPPPAPPAPAATSAPAAPPVAPTAPTAPVAPAAPAKSGISIAGDELVVKDDQTTRITGTAIRIQGTADGASPLYFVDGKEWAESDVSLIDPNRIKAVNVLKGNSATSVYGERAKEGVILIETKIKDAREPVTVIGYAKPAGDPPLYIVNGKEWTAEAFKKVKPENIESITVWKDKKAIEKYGEKGRNGVLVVELKKQ